ncbi:MAG: hypothetical protein FJ319_01945 [SAR202 cluster bacterium]|nr:hypothetical protein [SAR202 cluster bacterium]
MKTPYKILAVVLGAVVIYFLTLNLCDSQRTMRASACLEMGLCDYDPNAPCWSIFKHNFDRVAD